MLAMAIDRTRHIRKIVTMPREMAAEIEEYRKAQSPIPNETEAIRRLIKRGLEEEMKKKGEK